MFLKHVFLNAGKFVRLSPSRFFKVF